VILEGIVTTLDSQGRLNVAPMGPEVDQEMRRFVLKPFQSSTTYQNLKLRRQGVFHVTDDVLLIARTAIGQAVDPSLKPAEVVEGWVLTGACRYFEFQVVSLDDREPRALLEVEVVAQGRLRDFFGLNRAKHAVLEAAILATRVSILPPTEIRGGFQALAPLVEKTGGADEREAFVLLQNHVAEAIRQGELGPSERAP